MSTHKDLPLHLWCRLLPQAIVTLNLLYPSIINPTLSAHAQLHGQFDFNARPFAPPVTKVIVHQKPTIRQSWASRGKDGWYIDRAKDHYRCYNIYVPETRVVLQPDTVEFLPHNSKMLLQSSAENSTIAATELIHALRNPAPAAPYTHLGDAQMQALEQLAENFQHATFQSQQLPVSSPRVAPSFPRVTSPLIPVALTAPPIKAATPECESIAPPPSSQSDNRLHIIPPDKPTPPSVKQRNCQQKATNVPPLTQMAPHIIAPYIHRYPFRHQRNQQPAEISARYDNAANHIYDLEANAVLNPLTGVLQEFSHLIKGPDK